MNPQDIQDEEILRLFRESHSREKGFTMLVKKYQEKLYWQIRRMVLSHDDADDVLQNVFIKVWNNLENFQENSKLYTWLFRIATNESLTFLNQAKKRLSYDIDSEDYSMADRLKADPYFEGDEIQIKLQEAINTLPDKQKQVFLLRYYDEMKYEEMSDVLDTSVGALKASFHHAVKKIEKYLTER
jgi:RNA polymerase sigma factor (sigma-70 family)